MSRGRRVPPTRRPRWGPCLFPPLVTPHGCPPPVPQGRMPRWPQCPQLAAEAETGLRFHLLNGVIFPHLRGLCVTERSTLQIQRSECLREKCLPAPSPAGAPEEGSGDATAVCFSLRSREKRGQRRAETKMSGQQRHRPNPGDDLRDLCELVSASSPLYGQHLSRPLPPRGAVVPPRAPGTSAGETQVVPAAVPVGGALAGRRRGGTGSPGDGSPQPAEEQSVV